VLTSLLFLGVHLPGWSALHMLTVDRQVFVFVFGVVMAIVVRYSGSLWAAIVTHSTNDFMSFVLFHR
jgi:membrane protease YdiL (CAAX protease family)